MNKLMLNVFVAALLVGAVAPTAQVYNLPVDNSWWEATLVQNAGGSDATLTFTPIHALGADDSVTAIAKTAVISPGNNINFMPGQYGNITLGDGFDGSAVIQADQAIVAIGSIGNNPIGDIGITGGRAAAQYPGVGHYGIAKEISFPVVKNDYKDKTTVFFIQTVTPGTINVTYIMNEGANEYTASATTTEAGQRATFSPANITNMPSGCSDATCLGAAVFESTVNMVGVYAEFNTSEVDSEGDSIPAQILLATRGFTSRDYDTTVVMPAVKSLWRGRTTGIQIQNVGSSTANVTFTLAYQSGSASGADGKTVSFSIEANASETYFPGNHTAEDTLLGPFSGGPENEFLGSATITSDQQIVAICNENEFAAPETTRQTVYAGFAKKNATDTILFPLAKEYYRSNTTGIQIMNVGTGTVSIEASYAFQGSTVAINTDEGGNPISVDPGEAFTFYGVAQSYWDGGVNSTLNDDYGAVTVEATGTLPLIVGIAQEAVYPGASSTLDTKNYEGFNQ